MKSTYSILLLVILISISYILITKNIKNSYSNNLDRLDTTLTITFTFVGDLMCHKPQINSARTKDGKYNFDEVFELVKDYLSFSDFTAGNLETTIGDSNDTFSGYPRFRSPAEYLAALKNTGFDLLFTANNHSLDYGEDGVVKTINHIKNIDLNYSGTSLNFFDFDSLRIFDINGFRFCLIAATYGTNGNPIPAGKNYLINLINLDTLKKQILKAKKQNVDLIIVNLHFGDEYSTKPNNYQKRIVDSLLVYGADIIIGNHPHTLQPIETRKSFNSKIDSVIVAYSLGNFLSNQRKLLTATGAILHISIEKKLPSNEIKLKKIQVIPTYVFKGIVNGKIDYRIIPITKEVLENESHHLYFLDNKFLKSIANLVEKLTGISI